jgi:hypothetical protein
LVLHDRTERRYGWTTDEKWARPNNALKQLAQHSGHQLNMYGPGGALEIVNRWLQVNHGVH